MTFDPKTHIRIPGVTETLKLDCIVALQQLPNKRISALHVLDTFGKFCSGDTCFFEPFVTEFVRTRLDCGRVQFPIAERMGFLEVREGFFVNRDHIIAGVVDSNDRQLLLRGGMVVPMNNILPFNYVKRAGSFSVGGYNLTGTVYVNPRYWDAEKQTIALDTDITGYHTPVPKTAVKLTGAPPMLAGILSR